MITVTLDHLNITFPFGYDVDEFDISDLRHPCFDWVEDNGMKVAFRVEMQEVEMDDVKWDPIWHTDPRIFADFDEETDAIAFKLRWGEEEESIH